MSADTQLSDLTITGGVAKQREVPITDPGGGGIANGKNTQRVSSRACPSSVSVIAACPAAGHDAGPSPPMW
ncbi:hypothetical protein [Streptomyces sp. NPDC002889]|uniref:hypothetical protein n=1 Tax=Streptomyces sp. NPDC002889 TaxID=3364669 RepID=UPI00367EE68E